MKKLIKTIIKKEIVYTSLKVSLVVGTILNIINQNFYNGDVVSWGNFLLNYIVPYCVASYGAAKSEITK